MPAIDNPDGDGQIEIEIVDTETHHGTYHQIQATDDEPVTLSDQSGSAPWVEADEVMDA